jgi:hypothetical protein
VNGSEGLRRIAAVIRWIGIGLAAASLLFGLAMTVTVLGDHLSCVPTIARDGSVLECRSRLGEMAGGVAGGLGFAAFFYIGARVTAWIIEGFAAPK